MLAALRRRRRQLAAGRCNLVRTPSVSDRGPTSQAACPAAGGATALVQGSPQFASRPLQADLSLIVSAHLKAPCGCVASRGTPSCSPLPIAAQSQSIRGTQLLALLITGWVH